MNHQEIKFYKLNVKRKSNLCCHGNCFNNYINDNDSLFCGGCQIEKHVDSFCESVSGYLCEPCEKLNKTIKNMNIAEFKKESKKFLKGIDTLLNSFE